MMGGFYVSSCTLVFLVIAKSHVRCETENRPLVLNTWNFETAGATAWDLVFNQNATAIDSLVAGAHVCEYLQCDYTVGYGGSPDENGETRLDAMIFDGTTMDMGAVASMGNVKNAIAVAKHVLKNTKHSLLVGDLATSFAVQMGYAKESLQTNYSKNLWTTWKSEECQPNFWKDVEPDPTDSCGPYIPTHENSVNFHNKKTESSAFSSKNHDTIGMIVIDINGNIAAGTSTNGANHKIPGRVGDSPIPGAGAYADSEVGAAVATGDGDVMMRFLPSFVAVEELRNSIVETILQNDPFNVNAILDPQVHVDNTLKNTENSVSSKQIDAYLQGKQMSVEEEQQVLYALQRMSPDELCKITDRIYTSYNKTCDCDICNMYTNDNLCCDLKRSATSLEQKTANVPPIDIKSKQFQDCCEETAKYLRYVDSMQVLIYSLWLNDAGKRKISASETKLPSMVNHSYFVEYSIPDSLAKVKPINSARFCSKTLHDNQIYFRQSSIHDIKTDCLCDTQLRFTVSCRTLKQKQSNVLGVAKFNLGLLEGCKNLACCQRLTLYLNEQSAVVMGSLKVTVKLGCGRLYFGKKFIDAISGNERPAENSLDSSDASQVEINTVKSTAKTISTTKAEDLDKSVQHRLPYDRIVKVRTKRIPDSSSQTNNLIQLEQVPKICTDVVEINKQIVWGLIYISQAQFLEKVDSYCTYQPFCIEESTCTKTVCNSSNPVYDHVQKVPLIYEDDLLYRMRDNFTVLEFWGRTDGKFTTIGLAKLPLQQFYLSYRNPIVLKHLLKNKLPVISTDWWEPIEGLNGEDAIIGQVHVLLALGSDRQIHNLEEERGFCKDIVKAQAKPIINKVSPFKKAVNKGVTKIRAVNSTVKSVEIQTEMESTSVESPKVPSQEKLENFLSQLLQIQKVSTTDTSTNTEVQQNENPVQEEPSEGGQNLRLQKTSDLLDTLQKALSIEPGTFEKTEDSFKAHILIENALHLPVRKKCRSKKSKTKNVKKNDDLLPTTYVTFEALPNQELKVTPIVKKNSSPRWDYHCDVSLPLDLLTNNQKRLIFKVWRKSNLSVLEPCPQTDIVLGFAALDLTVLSAGLPSVHGWFNIVDFTSKCHGQIKIQVTPLENITKYNQMKDLPPFDQTSATAVGNDLLAALPPLKTLDESSELLSRTLKRKFIELDEITQRLRLRLSDVTRDESDTSNDEVADEFERDINTLCVEDDYDMINLETETDNYNQQRDEGCGLLQLQENTEKASQTDNKRATGPKLSEQLSIVTENSLCTLDRHLVEGKQRIDTLLEKLTLMSGSDACGTPSSRNGSGCSAMQDSTSNILKELGIESRPHINSESLYDPQMFRQIYTEDCTPSLLTSVSSGDCTSSDSSAVTMFSDCRRAPDGAGTSIDDK